MKILIFMLMLAGFRTLAGDMPVRVDEASTMEITVEKIDFMGWKECWRIRNETCELIVAPQISRVMHFSLRGHENLLWINPETTGKVVTSDNGQWNNLGGDKVWPTEQRLWKKYTGADNWPPPWVFDGGPSSVEPVKGGLRLTSQLSPHFGARCVREFVLDPKEPRVHVRQHHDKVQGAPVEMTLWNITQLRQPKMGLAPLGGAIKGGRHNPLEKLEPDCFALHPTVLTLTNHQQTPQKVGVAPDGDFSGGWIAALFSDVILVESHQLEKDARYPDDGCHAELYAAPNIHGGYIEIELLGPLKLLQAGQKLSSDCVWQILPLDKPEPAIEKAAERIRTAHQAALKILAQHRDK